MGDNRFHLHRSTRTVLQILRILRFRGPDQRAGQSAPQMVHEASTLYGLRAIRSCTCGMTIRVFDWATERCASGWIMLSWGCRGDVLLLLVERPLQVILKYPTSDPFLL
jgi:hypothetical protein